MTIKQNEQPKLTEDSLRLGFSFSFSYNRDVKRLTMGEDAKRNQLIKNYNLEFTFGLLGALKAITLIGAILAGILAIYEKFNG